MVQEAGLRKNITWVHGAAMTVGAVLGAGILVLPAVAADMAGPASLISWLLMGLFSLPMVVAIGAMSSQFPDSGGIATYARQAFGPHASQLICLLMLTATPFGNPVTALIGAHYLGSVFAWSPAGVHLAAAGLIIAAIALNYRGIELSGRVQVLVVFSVFLVLAVAVWSAAPRIHSAAFTPFLPQGWFPVGQATALLFYAFCGWEMLGHFAEEFKNPRRDIPLSLVVAVLLINALYLAVAVATVGTGVYRSGNTVTAMVTLVAFRWGGLAGALVAVLGFIVCYGTVHTYIAGYSRLIYAQARDGLFPKRFNRLHPRFQTPHGALMSLALVYLFVLLLSYLLSWNLKPLLMISCANYLAVYTLGMVSAARVIPSKVGKASAWIGAGLSFGVFLFAGRYMLYTLLVILVIVYCQRRTNRSPSMRT